jgi:hypothetical protein
VCVVAAPGSRVGSDPAFFGAAAPLTAPAPVLKPGSPAAV